VTAHDISASGSAPRITVLTTVYNGMAYLRECVDSVLAQTMKEFEFLIIDDASTDASVELIRSYDDPRIRLVLNDKNMGQARSLNRGLDLARGEIIARLDQDDACLPERLAEQLAYLDAHPDVGVLASWEISVDSDGKKIRTWEGTIPDYGDFVGAILLGLCPVWHPSAMFRKAEIARLGNFDPSYAPAEDYELWSRVAADRKAGALVPRFHLLQRVHDQRQSHLQSERQQSGMQRAHEKFLGHFTDHPSRACLGALLRLEPDPCGKGYDRSHAKQLRGALDELLRRIARSQRMSPAEVRSMRRRVNRRTLYALAPSVVPRVRALASRVYRTIRHPR
jgi:glycosyltransferase involved in cell wall biosynthesis